MSTAKRRLFMGILKVFNLGLVSLAFATAAMLQFRHQGGSLNLASFLSLRVKLVNLAIFAVMLVAWHAILSLCGLYQSQRLARRLSMVAGAMKATTLATLFTGVVAIACQIVLITPLFLFLFWVSASLLVAGTRMIIRSGLEVARIRGRNLRHILILGTNKRATDFARRLDATPELGYRVLGFVDMTWHGGRAAEARHPLCCDFERLPEFLRQNVVDEVANYLPVRSFYERSSQIAALCEQHGILMRFDPELFNLKIARARTDELDGTTHITAHSSLLDGWPTMLKRLLDVALSFSLLVVLSPLLAAIAILIKL